MEIFNVGPLELIIIVLIMFILLGPKEMILTAQRIGRWTRNFVRSPMWKEILGYSMEIRELPKKIMDESGLQDTLNEVQRSTREVSNEINAQLKEVTEAARVPEIEHLRIDPHAIASAPAVKTPVVAAQTDPTAEEISPTEEDQSAALSTTLLAESTLSVIGNVTEDPQPSAAAFGEALAASSEPAVLTVADAPKPRKPRKRKAADEAPSTNDALSAELPAPRRPRKRKAADETLSIQALLSDDMVETALAAPDQPVAEGESTPFDAQTTVKKPRRRKVAPSAEGTIDPPQVSEPVEQPAPEAAVLPQVKARGPRTRKTVDSSSTAQSFAGSALTESAGVEPALPAPTRVDFTVDTGLPVLPMPLNPPTYVESAEFSATDADHPTDASVASSIEMGVESGHADAQPKLRRTRRPRVTPVMPPEDGNPAASDPSALDAAQHTVPMPEHAEPPSPSLVSTDNAPASDGISGVDDVPMVDADAA